MKCNAFSAQFTAIFGIVAMLVNASYGHAGQNAYATTDRLITDKIPSAWLACTKSTDCDVISYSCGGRIAINRNHKAGAEKIVYSIGSSSWAACDTPVSHGDQAKCEAKRCQVYFAH